MYNLMLLFVNVYGKVQYISDSNYSNIIKAYSSSFVLVQRGSNDRERYRSNFIYLSNNLDQRTAFLILDGDNNKIFIKKYGVTRSNSYLFFRKGNFIEFYNGNTYESSISDYIMKKTGYPFTTFEDSVLAQDFIETNDISVVLYSKSLKEDVSKNFLEVAELMRDNFSFGYCPDQYITYELRVKNIPNIILYRNEDKARVEYTGDRFSKGDIIDFINKNSRPSYILFDLKNYNKYTNNILLFFTPVEQEKNQMIMKVVSKAAEKFGEKFLVSYIDAAVGNSFMQSCGFSKYADPAFVILKRSNNSFVKFPYPEGKDFDINEIEQHIFDFQNDKVVPYYRCSDVSNSPDDIVQELNANTYETFIRNSSNYTIVLFYQSVDPIYEDFRNIYKSVSEEFANDLLRFGKIDTLNNDIISDYLSDRTPDIVVFNKTGMFARFKGKYTNKSFVTFMTKVRAKIEETNVSKEQEVKIDSSI